MSDLEFLISQDSISSLPPTLALLAARLCLLGNWLTAISLLLIFFVIGVAAVVLKKQKKTLKFSLIAIFSTLLITLLITTGIKFWLSQKHFSNAQRLAQANLGQETVQELKTAASLHPLNDASRLSLAQASLALANQEAQREGANQKRVEDLIQEAIEEGKKAVLINPQKSENWLGLGNIYRFLSGVSGAKDWAIKCYQKASELDPDNPQIHELLATVYYSQGKIEEAKKELERALSLLEQNSPDFHWIKSELERLK